MAVVPNVIDFKKTSSQDVLVSVCTIDAMSQFSGEIVVYSFAEFLNIVNTRTKVSEHDVGSLTIEYYKKLVFLTQMEI